MANEENDFAPFVDAMSRVLDDLQSGAVYLVIDTVSTDRTLDLANALAARDPRYRVVWAPENRNVVDAYLAGFRAALRGGFQWIIEMDAGLSHDPAAIPAFLKALDAGHDCVFGSRFIPGGTMGDSPAKRIFLSLAGSWAAQIFLGCRMRDVTSGYEAFRREALEKLVAYPLHSRAHFYQTEVRYLFRKRNWIELPIVYRAPSPRVSRGALRNAFATLFTYTLRRFTGRAPSL